MHDLKYICFILLIFFDKNIATSTKKSGDKIVIQHDTDDEVINISANFNKSPDDDEWNMRYFPNKPQNSHYSRFSDKNRKFDVDPNCDDGKTNITMDNERLDENTICFTNIFTPDRTVPPIIHQDPIPTEYEAAHVCMDTPIEYQNPLLTFGPHRPLWGRYGEYKFIPKQRWLHNLEHGAVVMVYHPCAHPLLVNHLKSIVTSCLRRHIITPFSWLSKERPLALFTWGKFLSMNIVDPTLVLKFITQNALNAVENIERDGKYDNLLIKPAKTISDENDSKICPKFPRD